MRSSGGGGGGGGGSGEGMQRLFPWWWGRAHLLDYALVGVLFVLVPLVDFALEPFTPELPYASTNPTVAHSLRNSTVPTWSAGVLGYVAPLAAVAASQVPLAFGGGGGVVGARILGGRQWSTGGHELHHACLGLAEAAALAQLTTGVAKDFAGRMRPNYAALTAEAQRLNSTAREREARKSFPSGHSSAVFCGMTFLALWLAGKLCVFGGAAASAPGGFAKVLVVAAPEFAAMLVAITRVRDGWHNYSDIVAGALIGVACAAAGYFSLFHSLASKRCGLPRARVTPATVFAAEALTDVVTSSRPLESTSHLLHEEV